MCGNDMEMGILGDGPLASSAVQGSAIWPESGKARCKHFGCSIPSCGQTPAAPVKV